MKLFFPPIYGASLLFFVATTVFGMQEQQALAPRNNSAGIFDTLPKEIRYPMFAKLYPKERNVLRKTCKAFSALFSFYHPSKLILHKDFWASKRDISSIFVKAVFDGNTRLVEGLCNKYGRDNNDYYFYYCIERRCRFTSINENKFMCFEIRNELTLDPYFIADEYNNTVMIELLKKYGFNDSRIADDKSVFYVAATGTYNIMPDLKLLIACISRNTERIIQVITNTFGIHSSSIEHSLAVVIDNDDAQSIATMIGNKRVNECIKASRNAFLNLAIFGRHNKVAEVLIKSGCFDFNKTIKRFSDFGRWEGTYLDFIKCCLQCEMLDQSILDLLIAHGAKTSDELSIIEKCVMQ